MAEPPRNPVRVWDPLVRICHWLLVVGVVASWITRNGFGATHEWLGYFTLAIVVLRVAWGFGRSRYARFGQFVRPPGETHEYARSVIGRSASRYLGHNPLGGWMTLALLVITVAVCVSGWLYTTDRFWGIEWVEDLHNGLTNVLIGLVVLHVVGVLLSSLMHRENLVTAMITGRKRAPEAGDVH